MSITERESMRRAEVGGLMARTQYEWGLLFMAGLLVYGALGAWVFTWLTSASVSSYFIAIAALIVGSALTASAFRGSRYYNKRYEMIWNHCYPQDGGI